MRSLYDVQHDAINAANAKLAKANAEIERLHKEFMGALGRSEAKSDEIAQLRHDLERAMANHNADINATSAASENAATAGSAGTAPDKSPGVGSAVAAPCPVSAARFASWISVNERLPGVHEWVLACALSSDACMYIAEVVDGKWHDVDGDRGELDWISHWMPLPEAPK